MPSTATRLTAMINFAHMLCHYSLLVLPTAVLAMAAPGGPFGADYGPILALATGMFVLYGLLSLPQGWLAARFGRHRLIAIFFIGTGASLFACGFTHSPLALATCLAAAGAFAAIYHPIGTAMLVDAAGDRPGRALGTNGVCGNLGVASAPVITAALAATLGWRWAFLVPGVVFVAGGLAWLRYAPRDFQPVRTSRPFPPIPRHVVRRAVIVLLLIAVVSGLVFNAFTLLVPKLMAERLGAEALPLLGACAFAATLCGALTQFTIGRLIDRVTLRRVLLPVSLVLVPGLALLSVVQGWWVVPLAGLVSAAIFGQVTLNETMTARYISPALRTKMYSVRFFVGFLGSAGAAPLIGLLHERTGNLMAPTLVLSAFGLVTLGCALFFPDRQEELQPELWTAPLAVAAE
ncbi:MFS transporter [Acidisphaera sp. L21]|uniref:MFS transporter n=1 Tax=Acidisphaera sp. L21 TaxID=1641851 RepID=UPI00131A9BF5|nr:MFS transporter [Acidisphaera sp. L21]